MENPKTWNAVQKTIHQAIDDHRKGIEAGRIGFSLTTAIYNALLAQGHLAKIPEQDLTQNKKVV